MFLTKQHEKLVPGDFVCVQRSLSAGDDAMAKLFLVRDDTWSITGLIKRRFFGHVIAIVKHETFAEHVRAISHHLSSDLRTGMFCVIKHVLVDKADVALIDQRDFVVIPLEDHNTGVYHVRFEP